jgi:hypothetical protein
VNNIIEKYGVWQVAYARLYIGTFLFLSNCFKGLFSLSGRGLVEFDPSLSLHDDPETAVTIAGGYMGQGMKVYVMGLDVPKVRRFVLFCSVLFSFCILSCCWGDLSA